MEAIVTRCGYRCDLCLAYRPHVEAHPDDRTKLSDGWFKYFGFRIPPEEIACDGCMEDNAKLIDNQCPVRPCIIERRLDNCAQCGEYVCDRLKERLVEYEQVQRRLGTEIPQEDRDCFLRPYENKVRLEELRAARKGKGR